MPKENKNMEPEEKIAQLEEQIRELALTMDTVEDEKAIIESQLKKALADYQNLERSISGRIDTRVLHLKKDLAAGVIEVLDDYKFGQQARENLQLSDDEAAWADGMLDLAHKLDKALEGLGITKIVSEIGGEFDANIHEAVAVVDPAKGETPGAIKEIVQEGFMLGEFVVRAARVIVNKK